MKRNEGNHRAISWSASGPFPRGSGPFVAAALLLLFAWGTPAFDRTGRELISLHLDQTERLRSVAVGAGLEGVRVEHDGTTSLGGRLTWVKTRDSTGSNGYRHVFYRQYYVPQEPGGRVALYATSVGLHYLPDGTLWFAYGHQYRDVISLGRLSIASVTEALDAAQVEAGSRPDFSAANHEDWPASVRSRLLSDSYLMLEGTADGTTFRYRWTVHVLDARGELYALRLDAEDGSLLSIRSLTPRGRVPAREDCNPNQPVSYVAATGKPQNATPNGPLDENLWWDIGVNDSGGGITSPFEAVWMDAATGIQYEAYVGGSANCLDVVDGETAAFYKRIGVDEDKTLDCGSVLPEECPDPRNAAADALFNSRETMRAFDALFDRCGYDGGCGIVRVVANVLNDIDQASFITGPSGPSYAPEGSLACYKPYELPKYSVAAAIDIVAHEWGHGIEHHTGGLFDDRSLSEGFADVIGHSVERYLHGARDWTWDPETHDWDFDWHTGDWRFGEDWAGREHVRACAGSPNRVCEGRRRADRYDSRDFIFDGQLCSETSWYPGTTISHGRWSLHADDPSCPYGQIHQVGNQLAVALMLMIDGGPDSWVQGDEGEEEVLGRNPICAVNLGSGAGNVCGVTRDQPCSGCETEVKSFRDPNDSEGWKKGARILYKVLVDLSDHQADTWDDIAHLVKAAVFELYAHPYLPDPYCALGEQKTVSDAFKAIGRPDPDSSYVVGPICPEEE